MLAKKHHPFIFILNIIIFLSVIFFHITGAVDISIKTATPLLLLPLITAFSVFRPLWSCVLAGFLVGACMDSMTSGAYCFNTVVFILLAVFVSVGTNNLFNKNVRSATVLSFMIAAIYFILKWLVFHIRGFSMGDSMVYLLKYALPSAAYSAVFIFPFFYLYRYFNKILND